MGIDQRTRVALHGVGVEEERLREAERAAAESAREDANKIETFLGGPGASGDDPVGPTDWTPTTVYSDMDIAHSDATFPEHEIRYADLFTHSQDIRGYLRFASWGVPITAGRVLSESVIELTLGPTVNGRIRFARSRTDL